MDFGLYRGCRREAELVESGWRVLAYDRDGEPIFDEIFDCQAEGIDEADWAIDCLLDDWEDEDEHESA